MAAESAISCPDLTNVNGAPSSFDEDGELCEDAVDDELLIELEDGDGSDDTSEFE